MNFITINNLQNIPVNSIPDSNYESFLEFNTDLLKNKPERHCINYFGQQLNNKIRLYCCIADDLQQNILVSSTLIEKGSNLNSFTVRNYAFEKFEREIHENFNINYPDHPWLKPVRYPYNAFDKTKTIASYPFFHIESEELHEVGVGPVHAGIIEPGHFRFICNGEQILHLEIQLGYQHRGIENLFLEKKKLIQLNTLAENISGDSVAGHTSAFSYLWESLCDIGPSDDIRFIRTLAQEIERIAIHTAGLGAVCTDIAYQLGNSVFGRLRTPIINYFQEWCGNRFAKGLIRAGYNKFPFDEKLGHRLKEVFEAFEPDFDEMNNELFKLPSALSRFERTGALSYQQLLDIGVVGMTARMNTLNRDVRQSHPYGLYKELNHEPIIKHHGDVYSRVQIRKQEVKQSIGYIKKWLEKIPETRTENYSNAKLKPNSFAIALTEGWRGEICHTAITNEKGELTLYKIKDPSFHNWLALALSVRNNEISDFPISNKSFDLSYCGHDL